MKRTIYLPDGLDDRAQAADLNISGICQRALREVLDGKRPDVPRRNRSKAEDEMCADCDEPVATGGCRHVVYRDDQVIMAAAMWDALVREMMKHGASLKQYTDAMDWLEHDPARTPCNRDR